MSTPTILAVERLCKSYRGVPAVQDVSFDMKAGEMVAIIGPNGAGKSTCFNSLNGQIKPDGGRIRFDGREITASAPQHAWRAGIGRTFQITATFASMTVRENVQMVLLSYRRRLFFMWGSAARAYRDEADSYLDKVGMLPHADRCCGVLAYGDLKRLELAMALVGKPKLLLMDEPTAGMAPGERIELMALIGQHVAQTGISVLFTEHDMDVVFAHADRIIVLNRGQVLATGTPAEVRDNEEVRDVYLGRGLTYSHGTA
jgi:branched-chain amino acid transport system ATP-binding protein